MPPVLTIEGCDLASSILHEGSMCTCVESRLLINAAAVLRRARTEQLMKGRVENQTHLHVKTVAITALIMQERVTVVN